MKIVMPRHYVIKNGSIVPQDHINEVCKNNFKELPYIHDIRFLYGNKIYDTIRDLQLQNQELTEKVEVMNQLHSEETTQFNVVIYQQQLLIKERQDQLKKLKLQIEMHKKRQKEGFDLRESLIVSRNSEQRLEDKNESLSSTQKSRLSESNVENINDINDGISIKLLEKMKNSENILDQMFKLFTPNISYEKQRTKTDCIEFDELQPDFRRRKTEDNELYSQNYVQSGIWSFQDQNTINTQSILEQLEGEKKQIQQ